VNWFKYSSPKTFFPLAGKLVRGSAPGPRRVRRGPVTSVFSARPPTPSRKAYRIIFIHVPAAWMSMFLYLVMAFWAGLGLAFNTRLSGMMAERDRAHRRVCLRSRALDRLFLGKAHWGTCGCGMRG